MGHVFLFLSANKGLGIMFDFIERLFDIERFKFAALIKHFALHKRHINVAPGCAVNKAAYNVI